MPLSQFFTAEDITSVEAAVRDAEAKTSGEIIPYAVESSDDYDEALWRAGFFSGMAALLVMAVVPVFSSSWYLIEIAEVALVTFVASLIGVLLVWFVPPAKRFFAGKGTIERRVQQRAAEAFLTEEVFNTRERTGILIFLSLLEHRVIVLGDAGINAKVSKEEWAGVVKMIVDGIRSRTPAAGLIAAIDACGNLLQREGVEIRKDDTNELSNKFRTRKR